MKILYVGHTYTVRANQAKIAALASTPWPQSGETVTITLVTPHGWRGPLYSNRADRFDRSIAPNVDHRILRAFFVGKEGAYFFAPSIFLLIARLKPDIVHVEQGAYALSYLQIILALKLFAPRSRAVFFTWWNLPYTPLGIKRIAERFNLSHSACAIAGNEAARIILGEHGFERPIHVLPQLGVDVSSLKNRSSSAERREKPFIVGYAGRITEEKGVLDLVRAVGQMQPLDNVTLYMIGSGTALNEVRRTAAVDGTHFFYHESVRNEDLPEHLAKMDVLVLPSKTTPSWVEQFGHILLEAMALGVPVIGSSSGEIPHVISNAGLLFQEGNIAELSGQLELLRSNIAERDRLAASGRARVNEHFTHRTIAAAQMRIYEWMIRCGMPVGSRRTHLKSNEVMRPIPTTTNE